LPKGSTDYNTIFPSDTTRVVCEVESEWEFANIAGTFYEIPLFKVGENHCIK